MWPVANLRCVSRLSWPCNGKQQKDRLAKAYFRLASYPFYANILRSEVPSDFPLIWPRGLPSNAERAAGGLAGVFCSVWTLYASHSNGRGNIPGRCYRCTPRGVALHNDILLAIERIRADCNLGTWGTTMDALETVLVSLLIVWTPGIALAAYLLTPRRTGMD